MNFEAVIGLETHVQLNTNSKMFSRSSAKYQNEEPIFIFFASGIHKIKKKAEQDACAKSIELID